MTKILVCDDEREIVDAIEIYLMQEGYEVLKAYDGDEAIKILKDNMDVKLLIMDIMMPKLDGIHACMQIRDFSALPIIFLSAKSEDVDKILGLNIGADDYVTKPFNPLELVARVKSNLRRYTKLGNEVEEYEEFLESRCFPQTRDKMKLILKDLNLPFFDPLLIIQQTEGRMAEDDFWIRIERKMHD